MRYPKVRWSWPARIFLGLSLAACLGLFLVVCASL